MLIPKRILLSVPIGFQVKEFQAYVDALNAVCARSNLNWIFGWEMTYTKFPIAPTHNDTPKDWGTLVIEITASDSFVIDQASIRTNGDTGQPHITKISLPYIPSLHSDNGKHFFGTILHEMTHIVQPFEGYGMLRLEGFFDWRFPNEGFPFFKLFPGILSCPSARTQLEPSSYVIMPYIVELLKKGFRQPWDVPKLTTGGMDYHLTLNNLTQENLILDDGEILRPGMATLVGFSLEKKQTLRTVGKDNKWFVLPIWWSGNNIHLSPGDFYAKEGIVDITPPVTPVEPPPTSDDMNTELEMQLAKIMDLERRVTLLENERQLQIVSMAKLSANIVQNNSMVKNITDIFETIRKILSAK